MGIAMGLVEGTAKIILRKFHLVTAARDGSTAPQFVWICAIAGFLLLTIAAGIFSFCRSVMPTAPWARISVASFAFLVIFDWIALGGWVSTRAAAMLALGLAFAFTRWYRNHEAAVLQLWSRTLPAVIGVAVLSFVTIQSWAWAAERVAIAKLPPTSSAGPKNVLVIVVDTLRSDHLSAYGYSRITSPNIDQLARQGVLFENAFAAAPWTFPSHASMLTGRYPHEHGAETGLQPLDKRFTTISEVFEANGRRTGGFSANRAFFTRRLGLGRGFIHFEDVFNSVPDAAGRTFYGRFILTHVLRRFGFEDELGRKRAGEVTEAALKWIDSDRDKPFFAFLNYFDVHDPYDPPEPFRSKFEKPGYRGGIINEFVGRYSPHLTPAQLQGEIDAYDGAISYVDDSIGTLLAGIKTRGMLSDTLVVITSDHGESLGEHGLFLHRNALYRATLQVPLLFYWPGHIPAGIRVSQPVSNTELAATLADFLGDQKRREFRVPSLRTFWEHGPQKPWPLPAAELARLPFEFPNSPCRYGRMDSLLDEHWHYIFHEKYGTELYDWKTNPAETKDLAKTPEGEAVRQEFAARLHWMLASSAASHIGGPDR
jgi:arylsulfatase A-like enzyme